MCNYPNHNPVKYVRKDIQVSGSSVYVRVTVESRASVSLPLGTSVMFAVSPRSQATVRPSRCPCVLCVFLLLLGHCLFCCCVFDCGFAQRLVPGGFEYGTVFPGVVEPTARPTFTLSQGASFTSLSAIPKRVPAGPGVSVSGGDVPVDMSELPLPDTQLEASFQVRPALLLLATHAATVFRCVGRRSCLAQMVDSVSCEKT